jgi:hypothetical protein
MSGRGRASLTLLVVIVLQALVACTAGPPAATSASSQASTAVSAPPPVATATATTPTVDEIVAANVAARGGADRLHALQSMRAKGLAMMAGGKVAPVVREIARPGRIRLEITYQGLSSVYAHDGKVGWQVAPLQGHFEPERLPEEVSAPSVDQLDIEGPLVDWKAKGHTVTLVGRTKVGDRDAYDLELRLASGAIRHDFIDAQTFLTLRTDVERVVGGRKVPLETTFGDYRSVDGIVYPFLIETRRRGRPQSLKFVVKTIELNPAIDEARFQLPR